ncbi:hypothetical protein [Candidimonas nitroreducens]|uniref:Uncharacterized protein n=1 Tax=Candidimonas nitroreducens TaxID=683354 RepID=A0A225MT97_9BURK|nr:hypothetical protein [Candidimonas nitroreducens]OWT61879.1 hypothetical protein CEY11_08590 [Candidimonas nitroreducens]
MTGVIAFLLVAAVVGFSLYSDKRDKQERRARASVAYSQFWPAWERWRTSKHRIAIDPMTGVGVQNPGFWAFARHYANENAAFGAYFELSELILRSDEYKRQSIAGKGEPAADVERSGTS